METKWIDMKCENCGKTVPRPNTSPEALGVVRNFCYVNDTNCCVTEFYEKNPSKILELFGG